MTTPSSTKDADVSSGGRATPRPGGQRRKTARSVLVVDRSARIGITLGGIGIIGAVLGILVFILLESIPLFLPGKVAPEATYRLPVETEPPMPPSATGAAPSPAVTSAPPLTPARAGGDRRFRLRVGVDEYRELAWAIGARPEIRLFDPRNGNVIRTLPVDALSGATITAVETDGGGDGIVLGTADGRLLLGRAFFDTEWSGDRRTSVFRWEGDDVVRLPAAGPIQLVAGRFLEDVAIAAAVQEGADGARSLHLVRRTIRRSLLGAVAGDTRLQDLSAQVPAPVTALALTERELFAGTSDGRVYRFDVSAAAEPELQDVLEVEAGRPVTVLRALLGEMTLVAGSETGGISTWSAVREAGLGNKVRPFRRIRDFPPMAASVSDIAASPRNKSFAVIDERGAIGVFHNTTGRTLATIPAENGAGSGGGALSAGWNPGADSGVGAGSVAAPLPAIGFSPKADALFAVGSDGAVTGFLARIPHPEISLRSLFGKVWYEGYTKPDFVWQSTGGSDEFESKLSLVPLVFGTIKGTVYALLFAVPIALMAAIYTSQFMADRIRQFVKPTVEIMAALPSVVLGFLAGLFLAPVLETMVPATFVFLLLLPVVPTLLGVVWQMLPAKVRGGLPLGFELVALIPAVVITFFLARALGPFAEQVLFDGSFRTWLAESAGTRYDQRNCIVVGFAMGFAVIPIIFTIVEDSLSAVPQSLIAGSMACGASRWQTAVRILLPAAGSGIFSAIMIGFGRAVGETMIVLMATGNTPIMDWSIFNGMRTLSANIAVEMPEAPYRGTLYRVLFLAGLLLLLLTSIVNTAAELIRTHLKRKFGNY